MWRRLGWLSLLLAGCSEVLGFGEPVQLAIPEAATRPDGGGITADAGANPCDRLPPPTFCTRFDSDDWRSEWTRVSSERGSLERTSEEEAFSSPASLRVRVEGTSPAWASANVDFPAFAALPPAIEVAFRVRVDAGNADDRVAVLAEVLTVARPDGSPLRILQLTARQRTVGRLALSVLEVDLSGGQYTDHALVEDVALGQWTELRFQLSRAAEDSLTAHVGGALAFRGPLALRLPEGLPRFTLGVVHSDSASPSWDVRYDDVLVDYR